MRILVCGEALVDLMPGSHDSAPPIPVPGGSPLNVAVGLGRLGVPTGFLGKVSLDDFGKILLDHLAHSGVDTRFVVRTSLPTTCARVEENADGETIYSFDIDGAADRFLLIEELPDELREETGVIHCGSYSMALEPVGSTLTMLMEREQRRRIVAFDPNVRPALIPDWARYRTAFAHWASLCHVLKLSEVDLGFLCPEESAESAVRRWLGGATRLVVITRGVHGAVAHTRRLVTKIAGESVKVVDTVGAGDAFMSGLLAWLYERESLDLAGLEALDEEDLAAALRFANRAAAITCSRRGADPPARDELRRVKG